MSEAVLMMRGMRHRYGSTTALDGVDLSVEPGECVVLLGPNGAGKSTLVLLATGLLAPQEGVVRLAGGAPRSATVRRRLGVVLQTSGLPRTLTVRELVEGAAVRVGAPREAAARVLDEVGIGGLAGRRAHRLSGGQARRLQLAMALVGDPALLILDEPTEGLDPAARRDFWQLLEARRDRGVGLLVTTHLIEESRSVADRVVLMHRGRVIAAGTPRSLTERLPDRTVTLRTGLPAERLRRLPGALAVGREGNRVRITTRAPEALLRQLLAEDPTAEGLLVEGANLEQAVIALIESTPEEALV